MTDQTTNITQTTETIGEVAQAPDTPAQDVSSSPEDALAVADKVDSAPTDDPTLVDESDENLFSTPQENFLGTFKTKEDADKGFKDAQVKITEQGNRIKELEALLETHNDLSVPDNVSRKINEINKKFDQDYSRALDTIGAKYQSLFPEDHQTLSDAELIARFNSQQFAQMFSEVLRLKSQIDSRRKQATLAIQQQAEKAKNDLIEKDKQKFSTSKTGEMIFNAWYNPPTTIDGVADLFSTYKSLVIEDYLKEQSASVEDSSHKGKLSTNADSSNKPKYGSNHIFTLKELAQMSDKEFAKYEAIIDEQVAKRLVR